MIALTIAPIILFAAIILHIVRDVARRSRRSASPWYYLVTTPEAFDLTACILGLTVYLLIVYLQL